MNKLPELEQDAVAAARILPLHVAMLGADHAAGAALQATVGDERHAPVAFLRIAGGRATDGARLGFALQRADIGVANLDVWSPGVHAVTVLKQFFLDADHSKALHSLKASPSSPMRERAARQPLRARSSLD